MEGEIGVLQVEKKIRNRVKRQMEKTQREYYLNEQMKAIQKELGDEDGKDDLGELEQRIKNTKLTNAKTGEVFAVELLVEQPAFERVMLFYKPSLERLGVAVTVRTIDSSQYENRLRQWDFDIVISSWGESLSPGNEQRGFWGSQAADQPGSRNVVGIKNPAVDALIDRVIFAKDRDELVATTRALDRVLLWNYYVVPQWTYGKVRTARWDRFGRPQTLPKYGNSAFPTVWWWDKDKAAKLPQRS